MILNLGGQLSTKRLAELSCAAQHQHPWHLAVPPAAELGVILFPTQIMHQVEIFKITIHLHCLIQKKNVQ